MIPDSESGEVSKDSLFGEIAEEFTVRLRRGEQPDIDEYTRRYPQLESLMRATLPVLQALGDARSDYEQHSSQTLDAKERGDERVGDFRILREIGRGGMGVVFEAEQVSVGRRVALKILPFAALLNETQLERFNTEATAAARLQHDSIVQVYSVGCERGIHFNAMQLIEGPSLAEVIAEMRDERHLGDKEEAVDTVVARRADVLTRDEDGGHYRAVARIGKEAAEALQYAHEHRVLHRDIKPSNLLLDKSGHVWIADFGLARVEDESQLTRTGDILGTLRYMSPEQATGDRVDARSDVYSLGATLYELVTLKPVFDNEDRREIIKQVIAGNPVAPHEVDDRVPKPLSHVIGKSMARLDERYQSAQELSDDLRRFLFSEAVTAKPPTRPRRARAWARRHRLASAAIVSLLILIFLSPFTYHFFQRGPDASQTKGQDMKVSKTAKVAAAAAAMAMVTVGVNAKKPVPPPPVLTVNYELWGAFLDPDAGSLVKEGGLVQQPDGKFLNVGMFLAHDPWLALAIRWNIDGTEDTEFGNDEGRLVFDVGDSEGVDWTYDVTVQPDGKIIMAGVCNDYSSPWIARLNPDGSFDTDFGNAGIVTNLFPDDYAQFHQVAILSDGSLVAIGGIWREDDVWGPLLVKFTSDGVLDTSFGEGGISIITVSEWATLCAGKGFTELPDGRLVAPGSGLGGRTSAVWMFNSDGSLDTSFGNHGIAEIDLQVGGAEFFHALSVQPDGKIVAVGATSTDPSTSVIPHHIGFVREKFSIARFNADGSLDKRKFAKPYGGIQLDLAAGGEGEFSSVELLSDGRILAVGEGDPGDGVFDIFLARFQTNGTLDTSFDDDGWINLDVLGHDCIPGLVIMDDHNYMIGGTSKISGGRWTPFLARVWEE